MTTPRSIVRTVLGLQPGSQLKARRNALLASTALAQQSHDRREVEEFLDALARRWQGGESTAMVAERQ